MLFGPAWLLAAMSCLTLALPAAEPLVAAMPHKNHAQAEKKGGKTIHRTFSSAGSITINDNQEADPYPSTIKVSGLKKSKVTDVNVVIRNFTHDFPANVDIALQAPNGASTIGAASGADSAAAIATWRSSRRPACATRAACAATASRAAPSPTTAAR